jgi:hypothetical protein
LSLESWANAATIVSGAILALAAVVAFIVQRARYLAETYVIVDVSDASIHCEVAGGKVLSIHARTTITNKGNRPIFVPHPKLSQLYIEYGSGQGEIPTLPPESKQYSLYPGESVETETYSDDLSEFNLDLVGGKITGVIHMLVDYYIPFDLLHLILLPWQKGRRTYKNEMYSGPISIHGYEGATAERIDRGEYGAVVQSMSRVRLRGISERPNLVRRLLKSWKS